MARRKQEGNRFFRLDVDFFSDKKVKILKARYGADGVTLYLYILCEIYKAGYYLKIDDDAASVDLLIRNFPDMNALYPLPVDKIQELNIPALNYGCYGKDAHKWTERLYKPYTFGVLPKLILKTIDNFL